MASTADKTEVYGSPSSQFDTRAQKVPLVRYGMYTDTGGIPGDKFGRKTKASGNVSHVRDPKRAREFPRFNEADFALENPTEAEEFMSFLDNLRDNFLQDRAPETYANVAVISDTSTEKIVNFSFGSLDVRIMQFRDVDHTDTKSYVQSKRAKELEERSSQKMQAIEPPMDKDLQDYLMAEAITGCNISRTAKYRFTVPRPAAVEESEDEKAVLKARRKRKEWYKTLRLETIRHFWVDNDETQRAALRQEASASASAAQSDFDLRLAMDAIRREDSSRVQDAFYQHHKDNAAAEDPGIYDHVQKDLLLVLDKHGETVLCYAGRLFQRLFGEDRLQKTTGAAWKWSALPPLPLPNTARHMVDELMRSKYPDIDLEKATTPEELEGRPMCVAHYGTWAEMGHPNPENVFLTPDTILDFGIKREVGGNSAHKVLPQFRRGVFGLCSEVVRCLLRRLAPDEYQRGLRIFEALRAEERWPISRPTFSTLNVIGFNCFTERHKDRNDIKLGLTGLVPLGAYTGGDLCFPQLGIKLVGYQPGAGVIFRGAELEHFVTEWQGKRIFVICTNHKSVENYGLRRRGEKPALRSDPWYKGPAEDPEADGDGSELPGIDGEDTDEYDPCGPDHLDIDEELERDLTEAELQGAGTWSPNFDSQGSKTTSSGSSKSESRSSAAGTKRGSVAEQDDGPAFSDASSQKRRKLE